MPLMARPNAAFYSHRLAAQNFLTIPLLAALAPSLGASATLARSSAVISTVVEPNTASFFNTGTGKWTTIDDPLGINTECEGINNKGQIVGIYFANGIEHGFLASKVNGQYVFTDIDDPLGVKGTGALGINNHGEIVGIYFDAGR